MATSQANPAPYADLEIRILDRQAAGYPVELTGPCTLPAIERALRRFGLE